MTTRNLRMKKVQSPIQQEHCLSLRDVALACFYSMCCNILLFEIYLHLRRQSALLHSMRWPHRRNHSSRSSGGSRVVMAATTGYDGKRKQCHSHSHKLSMTFFASEMVLSSSVSTTLGALPLYRHVF